MRTRNSIRGFVHPSVGWSVSWSVGRSGTLELKSGKTGISAPAHLSATDGRVSGLVESADARDLGLMTLFLKEKDK